jgi:hypothetical protein
MDDDSSIAKMFVALAPVGGIAFSFFVFIKTLAYLNQRRAPGRCPCCGRPL